MGWEEACGRGDISQEAQVVLEEAEKRCDKTLTLKRHSDCRRQDVTPTSSGSGFEIHGLIFAFGMTSDSTGLGELKPLFQVG